MTDRGGARLPTVLGMLLSAVALAALALVSAGGDVKLIVLLLALLGVGMGLFTPPNNSAIMGSAPANRLGVAGGILNMTRSIGTSLGVALTGALLGILLSAQTGEHVEGTLNVDPAALQVAVQITLLFLAALALVAGVLSGVRGSAAVAKEAPGQPASASPTTGRVSPAAR
jgi:MFS family permease